MKAMSTCVELAALELPGEQRACRRTGRRCGRPRARRLLPRLARRAAPPPRSARRAAPRPRPTAACTTGTRAGAARRRAARGGATSSRKAGMSPSSKRSVTRQLRACSSAWRSPLSRAAAIMSAAVASRSSSRSGRHSATWRALSAEASALPSPARARGRDRLGAERLRARAVGRVVELDGEPGLQARAQHGVGRAPPAPPRAGRSSRRRGRRSRCRGRRSRARPRRAARRRACRRASCGRVGERLARGGGLAGAQERVAAGEQHRAGLVLRLGERERVERAGEALGGVLVGEAVERAAPGADEHLGRAAGVGGLEQVGGDLLEVAALAEPGERVRGAAVQPLAAQHVELVRAPPRARARARTRSAAASPRAGAAARAAPRRARPPRRRARARRWPAARPRPARGRGSPRRRAARWRRR